MQSNSVNLVELSALYSRLKNCNSQATILPQAKTIIFMDKTQAISSHHKVNYKKVPTNSRCG